MLIYYLSLICAITNSKHTVCGYLFVSRELATLVAIAAVGHTDRQRMHCSRISRFHDSPTKFNVCEKAPKSRQWIYLTVK